MMTCTLDKDLEAQMRARNWKWTRLGSKLFVATAANDNLAETLMVVRRFYRKATLNDSQLKDVAVIKIGRAK